MDLITTKGKIILTGIALLFGISYMTYYFIKYELPEIKKRKEVEKENLEKKDINE